MSKLEKLVLSGIAILLCATAAAKLLSAFLYLDTDYALDPLFKLRNTYVIASVALVEIAIVCYVYLGKSPLFKWGAILWLSFAFIGYRAALYFIGITKLCSCLGHASQLFPAVAPKLDFYLRVFLSILLLSSVLGVLKHGNLLASFQRRRDS